MKRILISMAFTAIIYTSFAQGNLSGDLMTNLNFYQYDPKIDATNSLYKNYLTGGEAWLGLRYSSNGFDATLRMDALQNSNLFNPGNPLSLFGIGSWSLSKSVGNLAIKGGYIYDQIGSGILFRSYEDRALLIDNALVGLELKYKLNDHVNVKGFAGQQKNLLQRWAPIIKGLSIEGDFNPTSKVQLSPGIGLVNRTLDENTHSELESIINAYPLSSRFEPTYNTTAVSIYNTLTTGNFSWYAEGAYKSHEAIYDASLSNLYDKSGTVLYSTLAYAKKGFAININGKRTENFDMHTSPFERASSIVNQGVINWQPVIARIRPQRLIARYTPASQDLSEQSLGTDILITPNEKTTFTLNANHINTLEGTKLYRELYGEFEYRPSKKVILQGGLQYLQFNQALYQIKPGAALVEAITPFAEITYKITSKKSIRIEGEYMETKQDKGSWAFLLAEYNISPHWSFAISDMYNIGLTTGADQHYPNLFMAYTHGANRFTLAYVKQLAGINCTGGVCRQEPAFSGLKLGITSSF